MLELQQVSLRQAVGTQQWVTLRPSNHKSVKETTYAIMEVSLPRGERFIHAIAFSMRVGDIVFLDLPYRGSKPLWTMTMVEDSMGDLRMEANTIYITRYCNTVKRVVWSLTRGRGVDGWPDAANTPMGVVNHVVDRVFIRKTPTGIVFADRVIQEDNDYKNIAFLPYSTLELRFSSSEFLLPRRVAQYIKRQARSYQERRGEKIRVTASEQYVVLGGEK